MARLMKWLTLSVLLEVMLVFVVDHVLAASRVWWVSWMGGQDYTSCGQRDAPCHSISYTLALVGSGDTVRINAHSQLYRGDGILHVRPPLYTECSGLILTKSVTLTGFNGRPQIGCPYVHKEHLHENDTDTIFNIQSSHRESDMPYIGFHNLHIQNGWIRVNDTNLDIDSCVFDDVAVRSLYGDCTFSAITITNSVVQRTDLWSGEPELLSSSVVCHKTQGKMYNSTFSDVNWYWAGIFEASVEITRCMFTQTLKKETGIGGVNISVPYANGYVNVSACVFEKHVHYDPIMSSINIESSSLRIESHAVEEGENSTAMIDISDSVFRENERAISISSEFANITMVRCVFEHNVVMHAAPAIRLAIGENNYVQIRDSAFRDNTAGFNKHKTVPGRFQFDGVQVWISGEKINGIISLVGKGGAVRLHRGIIIFDNCTFLNNTARLLGGAVFLDRNATADFNNCYFENSHQHQHAVQGDLIYSGGAVTIRDSVFKVVTAKDHISMLRHSGDHWSMEVKKMWFECPTGHRLVMVNNTSHQIHGEIGLKRSHRLDQLYYYCQTCGENQYSVDRGFLNYTVTSNQTDYFTLKLDGKQPFLSHPVKYNYGNITCRQCPYGGDCEGEIRSIANFWGYHIDEEIAFQHCPSDYCCLATNCPTIDTCAEHRSGRMCGRCDKGYSEALFSSSCVPNHVCNSSWIWGVLILMGVLYTLFLIFQKDLRDFLGTRDIDLASLKSCCMKKSPNAFVIYVKRKSVEIGLSPSENHNSHMSNGIEENSHTVYYDKDIGDNIQVMSPVETVQSPSPSVAEDNKESGHEAGTLIILFYYFQDALLLHINTIYTKTVSKFVKRLKTFLVGLFRFRLDFFQFLDDVCLFPNLQPVDKMFFKALFVPFVLFIFGLSYLLFKFFKCLHKGVQSRRPSRTSQCSGTTDGNISPPKDSERAISCRLASGFILALLFTYQKLATATFALLNCVPVGNETVLFMDGTQTCFQPWQYGVIAYALLSVVPFCVIIMLGPPLLSKGEISLSEFFLGCLFPLPAILWFIFQHVRPQKPTNVITPQTETVIQILQGPFKESQSNSLLSQVCWAGLLLGRRLILFLCYTFINDVLVRLLCMMCSCFVILMHHMYIRPYKTSGGNLAGAFSAAALLVVGAINLIRAGFEAAEYIPQGPYKFLMEVCEEIENTLVLWLPLAGICIMVMFIVLKLMLLLAKRTQGRRHCCCNEMRSTQYQPPVETQMSI